MNKKKIAGIILSGAMFLSLGVNGVMASNVATGSVHIATGSVKINQTKSDKQIIENEIRRTINKPTGKLTTADFAKVTKIDLNGNKFGYAIRDISSIKNLKNLVELNICSNNITNISPIKNLTKLTKLSLGMNPIKDISALKNLVNLKELAFINSNIKDISVLKNCTKLTNLVMESKQIKDISALKNLNSLEFIDLRYCSININILKGLPNLKGLDISEDQKLTYAQVAKIKKSLPKCTIYYYMGVLK